MPEVIDSIAEMFVRALPSVPKASLVGGRLRTDGHEVSAAEVMPEDRWIGRVYSHIVPANKTWFAVSQIKTT